MGCEAAFSGAQYSVSDYVVNTVENLATDLVMDQVFDVLKVDNVTKGRGNYLSTYRGGLTRMRNGNASTMSNNVIWKGIWGTIVGDFHKSVYSGLDTHMQEAPKYFHF